MFSTLILSLIVVGLVYWLITYIPLPEPFKEIVKIVFIIAAVVLMLKFLGVAGLPSVQ